jgi:hypothetical protein
MYFLNCVYFVFINEKKIYAYKNNVFMINENINIYIGIHFLINKMN